MNKYLTLTKLLIKNSFNFKSKKEREKDGKRGNFIAIVISLSFLYIMVLAITIVAIYFLGPALKSVGLTNELLVVLFGISALVILFLGLFAMLNTLYFSKDNEFFMALPIKPSTIYLAKMTVVYLTELSLAALLLIPATLTFGIVLDMPFYFYIFSIFGIILAPAMPLMLAAILTIPLMYIVGFFRNRGVVTSIFVILIFGAIMGAYIGVMVYAQNSASNLAEGETDFNAVAEGMRNTLIALSNVLYPYLAFARMATGTEVFGLNKGISILVNGLMFFAITFSLVTISILISNAVYKRGASVHMESGKKKTKINAVYTSASPLKTLVKKEWRELIRAPYFAFQSLSGIIIAPLFAILYPRLIGAGFQEIEGFTTQLVNTMNWYLAFAMVLMLGIGMNLGALSSFTREGENFAYAKTLPLDVKTIVKAKVIFGCIIGFATILLSFIAMTITTKDFISLALGLPCIIIYTFGYVLAGVFNDLRKPKLKWATPNEAMKHNMNMMIPFFFNMGISMVILMIGMLVPALTQSIFLTHVIVWPILYTVAICSALIFYNLLNSKCEEFYERIEV